MIISASRRTDIPSYFSDWFYNRIKDQYVLVRNPMNFHRVSKVSLSPDVVDCIVFWTKNPTSMLEHLDELHDYAYYFQFTLNAYSRNVEPNVPKKQEVVETFKRLSDLIGPEKVIWRYDPIFISHDYSINYHIKYFEELVKRLSGYTKKCTISFMDFYRKTVNNTKALGIEPFNEDRMRFVAKQLSEIATAYGLRMDTCSEKIDLSEYGIDHAKCVDDALIEKIVGCKLKVTKDKNQRLECGCVSSIDIGAYNTCLNGCKYCYANYSEKKLCKKIIDYIMKTPHFCMES